MTVLVGFGGSDGFGHESEPDKYGQILTVGGATSEILGAKKEK